MTTDSRKIARKRIKKYKLIKEKRKLKEKSEIKFENLYVK
jgi:hypothetical protein